ncbi:MAG: thioredoxin-dependent thiol peroxidase [Patescibacteria group bacterium]|nr:thioredoxin-dependent thiol peroxidase [Patescibacteria group bacterium]MDE2588142.1 thioredoxin-dependent thiol peroxidase [Patescibacteria group bacterium]
MLPEQGTQAPQFSLPDQNNIMHSLAQYLGKWVLVYFYPKDDTPGCTSEACSFRDNLPKFSQKDVVVLGISVDSVDSHRRFSDKYHLPFPILSDEKKEVVNEYGVWQQKKFMGKSYMGTMRTSFLINPTGKIIKVYEHVKPEMHVAQVQSDLLAHAS